jgi:hypothetical protein
VADKKSEALVPVPLLISIVVTAVLAAAAYFYSSRRAAPPPPGPATAEEKAYSRNLKLSEVGMKSTASYLGAEVIEIVGKITNQGDRDVKHVELTCIFYDPYGQVVRRVRVPIVKAQAGGLKVGETKPFRLPFDDIPASWSKEAPQIVIAQIVF